MPLMIERPDAAAPLAGYYDDLIEAEQEFYIPAATENFVSTGILANDEFTSVLDGDPVIRSFKNMTINENHIVRPTNRCKGMFIYVEGDLVVNGTLSMTARGAKAEGKYVGIDPHTKEIHFANSNIYSEYPHVVVIPKQGGSGGISVVATTPGINTFKGTLGNGGENATVGACGGGGSGGAYSSHGGTVRSGAGSAGTSFSGGAGGGGCTNDQVSVTGYNGAVEGGAGGAGRILRFSGASTARGAGGGAGNPGGAGAATNGGTGLAGSTGSGGLMILFVKGNIVFGTEGKIESKGTPGGRGSSASGGSSGGGTICIFHKGIVGNPEKISVAGGEKTASGAGYNADGGSGGVGTLRLISM
mgnify:CR=1 FL=1